MNAASFVVRKGRNTITFLTNRRCLADDTEIYTANTKTACTISRSIASCTGITVRTYSAYFAKRITAAGQASCLGRVDQVARCAFGASR